MAMSGGSSPVAPVLPTAADATKALEFFKDWSNYLLVTTVAALGWVSSGSPDVKPVWINAGLKPYCIWFLAGSIVFGIFTLALIPLVQEQRDGQFNHRVRAKFWLFPNDGMQMIWVCMPQHLLFIAGIIAYAIGTTGIPKLF